MAIKIERGVPIPPRAGGAGRPAIYPFRDMVVGDSFSVPLTGEKHRTGNDMAAVRLSTAIAHHSKRLGARFSRRTLPDEVRVWRIA